ncbi:hypothetical protein DFH07DRAFT_49081 [Mycena maculata]|uniref:Uncharacterized protein n=1 Tax=Mycena maculata TaxID=230809 RepID=A0AAD7IGK7_9AGAR|nr:hypothetical protein DFH07DRAFT_49081 [Mycena maculata]
MSGTHESLTAGVPMICWPLAYDQPTLAMSVSQVLGCLFELSEVRWGLGHKYRASTGKTAVGRVPCPSKSRRQTFWMERSTARRKRWSEKRCSM